MMTIATKVRVGATPKPARETRALPNGRNMTEKQLAEFFVEQRVLQPSQAEDVLSEVELNGKTVDLGVGQQMRRADEGEWSVSGNILTETASTSATSDTTSSSASSADEDDVVKRLMKKREEEMKK